MSLITFRAEPKKDSDGNLIFKTDGIAQGLVWLAFGILLLICFYGMVDITREGSKSDGDAFSNLIYWIMQGIPGVVLMLIGGRYLLTWTVLRIDARTSQVEWRKNGFWMSDGRKFDLKELEMAIYPGFGRKPPELRLVHKGTFLMRLMSDSNVDRLRAYATELGGRFKAIVH